MEDSDIQQIEKMIQDGIKNNANDARFNVVPIPAHQHTGVDSNKVDASNITNLVFPKVQRVLTINSAGGSPTGTFAPRIETLDLLDISSATGAITLGIPAGQPLNGQNLWVRVTSSNSATARSISFSSATGGYIAGSPALPSATTTGQTLMLGFMYDTTNSLNKWRLFVSASA